MRMNLRTPMTAIFYRLYNLKELKMIAEYSTILQQCVDAYRTNIVGFGFDFEYSFDVNSPDVTNEEKTEAESEWTKLEEFAKYLHFDESAETLLGFVIEDRERQGMDLSRSFETVKISQLALNTWMFKMFGFVNCLNQLKLILHTSNKDK